MTLAQRVLAVPLTHIPTARKICGVVMPTAFLVVDIASFFFFFFFCSFPDFLIFHSDIGDLGGGE
jgi:hypothetical protein